MNVPMILAGIAVAVFFIVFRILSKRKRRQMLLQSRLSDAEREIMFAHVPMIKRLPPDLAKQHEGKVNLFLDQVEFTGYNGVEITDDIRLSIAAQACLLIVNSDAWYKHLRTILVYPSAFKSKSMVQDGPIIRETEIVRLGESWARGPVVLSWAHSKQGAAKEEDGHNLVLHEFAHQLDDLSGQANGAPVLNAHQSFADWERVFLDAYARHLENVEKRRKTVLDPYGAENHQEFFAVAIEVFFEKPEKLNAEEPAVFEQISQLLRLDPRSWQ